MYSTEQEKLITPFRAQREQRKEHEQFMKVLASCSLRVMHSVPKGAAGSREEVSHDIYEFLMGKLRGYEEKWEEWKRWGGEKPQFPFPRKWSVSWIATAYYNHLHSERSKEKNPYGYYKKAMRRAIREKSRNSDTLFTDTAARWTHYSRRPITERLVDYTRFMLEEQAGPLAGWPAPGVAADDLWKSGSRESLLVIALGFLDEAADRLGAPRPMSIDMLMAYLCAQYRFLNDPWIASFDTDEAVNLHDRIPDGREATRYEEADLRLMGEDIRRSLEECVGRWKPEWRRFLWLRMFMEMNEADICRACNVSRVSYPLEQMYSDMRRAFEDLGVENENDAFLLASDALFDLCGQEVDKATLDKRDTRP